MKSYPDGRREMMPRAYTSAVLFGASVTPLSRRNNSRSIFARTETAYRRIEERMAGTRRCVREAGSEVTA